MISTLMFVVNYDIMGLEESFNGSCFQHFFPRHANMGLPRRKFTKTWDLYQLRMCDLTFKSALLSRKVL